MPMFKIRLKRILHRNVLFKKRAKERVGLSGEVVNFGSELLLTKPCHFPGVRPYMIKKTWVSKLTCRPAWTKQNVNSQATTYWVATEWSKKLSSDHSMQAVLIFEENKQVMDANNKYEVKLGSGFKGGRYWFERVKVWFYIHFIPVKTKVSTPEVLPFNNYWFVFFNTRSLCQTYRE